MRAGSSSAQTWQAIQFIRTEEVYIRVPKTSAACRPECFSASRKSGKLPNNLESFRRVWEVSGGSGKFPEGLESFRRVWKVSWQSGMFLENLESFHRVRKVVKCVWKVSRQSGKSPAEWKVSGQSWICLFFVWEPNILDVSWCCAFHAMPSNLAEWSCDTAREVALLSERLYDLMRGCAILREVTRL